MTAATTGRAPQRNSAEGFTLIELVVVITILGILAATAAPRFIDLQGEAKESAAKSLAGSLQAGANQAHSKAVVTNSVGDNISMGGQDITMNGDGYPDDMPNLLKTMQSDPTNSGWTTGYLSGNCNNLGSGNVTGCINDGDWEIGYDDGIGSVAITDSDT